MVFLRVDLSHEFLEKAKFFIIYIFVQIAIIYLLIHTLDFFHNLDFFFPIDFWYFFFLSLALSDFDVKIILS